MYKFTSREILPHSWTVTTLSDVAEINPLINFAQYDDDTLISFVPMPLVEELTGRLDSSRLEKLGKVKKGYTRFLEGDVLFAKITPCMENGKVAIASNLKGGIGAGSTEFHVLRSRDEISNQYVLYYLLQNDFRGDAQHHMTGMVGQKRVPSKFIENSEIPLAPLNEQRRIVSKIEELFSRLDEGEAALRRVQRLLASYRQVVLKAAVTGELTKEWREANQHRLESGTDLLQRILKNRRTQWQRRGQYQDPQPANTHDLPELPVGWIWATLPQLGEFGRGKSKHRPRNDPKLYEGGIYPFLQTGQVRNSKGRIKTYDRLYSEFGLKQSKLWPAGTVCITIAANIAETGILEFDACFPDSVVGLVPYQDICGEYVELFMRTARADLDRYAPATAQKNINIDILEGLAIPLPSVEEQQQIYQSVSQLFSDVEYVEKTLIHGLMRSSTLRQSILKAAFSGELVEQDPSDEPSSALLQRIQAIRQAPSRPQTKGTRPPKQATLWEPT